jgi:hypothetical protein
MLGQLRSVERGQPAGTFEAPTARNLMPQLVPFDPTGSTRSGQIGGPGSRRKRAHLGAKRPVLRGSSWPNFHSGNDFGRRAHTSAPTSWRVARSAAAADPATTRFVCLMFGHRERVTVGEKPQGFLDARAQCGSLARCKGASHVELLDGIMRCGARSPPRKTSWARDKVRQNGAFFEGFRAFVH